MSEEAPWRYEIKHGPDGEANYAWVYDADNNLVCTARTHHAIAIVEAWNRRSPPSPGAMPVAWMIEDPDGELTTVVTTIPQTPDETGLLRITPLFAHPTPSLEGDDGELVERLRSIAEGPIYGGTAAEAATRLSTLAAELERMRTKCFGCITPAEHGEALASAKAEVERLRSALEAVDSEVLLTGQIAEIVADALLEERTSGESDG